MNNGSREHKSRHGSLLVDERASSHTPDNGPIDHRRFAGNKKQEGGRDIMHSMNNEHDEATPILTENVQDLKGSNSDE